MRKKLISRRLWKRPSSKVLAEKLMSRSGPEGRDIENGAEQGFLARGFLHKDKDVGRGFDQGSSSIDPSWGGL